MELTQEDINKIQNEKIDLKMNQSFEPFLYGKKKRQPKVKRFWKVFINDKEIFKGKFAETAFFYASMKRNYENIQAKVHPRAM